jgi:hypothetical protein
LQGYRDFEDQGDPAGDRFEGMAYSCFSLKDRDVCSVTLSGFDTLVFCASADRGQDLALRERFGPVVLEIDLHGFAERLWRTLRPLGFSARRVRYVDLKLFRSTVAFSLMAGYIDTGNFLSARFARVLRRASRLPSVFAKPSRFADEHEVRLAWTLAKDVTGPEIVNDPGLLKFVRRVD